MVRVHEVPALGHPVHRAADPCVLLAEDGVQLGARPDKELALDALAVGVLGAVEAALTVEHLALEVVERLAHDPLEGRVAAELVAVQVDAGELRVVVEHLLEVRDQPLAIDAVARKAATELVVHAAGGHRAQRRKHHASRGTRGASLAAQARLVHQQELEPAGVGELGCSAEAAPLLVEPPPERFNCLRG